MIAKAKLSYTLLDKAVRDGKTQVQIAKEQGVTKSAVCKAIKKFRLSAFKVTALERAGQIVDANFNIMNEIQVINRRTHAIMDKMEAGGRSIEDKQLILKCCAEIRQQCQLNLNILQVLSDAQAVKEFQREVLDAIQEVDPSTKKRIVERLKERRALRWATELPR